jgi:hypothetical protein
VITGYKWELYNVNEDVTEPNDLAAKMPGKLKEMENIFYSDAKEHDVVPLDNSTPIPVDESHSIRRCVSPKRLSKYPCSETRTTPRRRRTQAGVGSDYANRTTRASWTVDGFGTARQRLRWRHASKVTTPRDLAAP